MRRLLGWIGGAMGGVAAYRRLRRRPRAEAGIAAEPEPPPAGPDERAEELRAKLAESRTAEEPAAEPAEPAGPAEPAEPTEPESPEERRRRVHEEGRAAIDEMQSE